MLKDTRTRLPSPSIVPSVNVSLLSDSITVSRRVWNELHCKLKRRNDTIDNAVEGIVQTTKEGKFVYANPAFAKILGYTSPEELIHAVPEISSHIYVNPELRKQFMEAVDVNKNAKFEYEAWKRDGSTTWLQVSSRAVTDAKGTFLYYESIVEDITTRKTYEAQLKQLTESLTRSNTDLKRYASVVAHDLSGPLATVESYCNFLKDSCQNVLGTEDLAFLDSMSSSIARMRMVIRDTLEISQTETNPLHPESVDLNLIVEEVLQDLQALIQESHAEISVGELPVLKVDHAKILRLFQNLISNAIKFRRKDVPLQVSISSMRRPDGKWDICVQDNGMGFEPKYSERIFEMFSRFTTPENRPGSGMGLALCKRIVDAHGGRIIAESTPGVGTKFWITL